MADEGFPPINPKDSIDSYIGAILNWKYRNKWDKKKLYSWTWGLGNGYLDPKTVYEINTDEDYKIKTFDLSKLTQTNPVTVSSMRIFEKDRWFFGKKKDLILDLSVEGHDIGHSYHVVVTNMLPDKRMFRNGALYEAVGHWYSEPI